MKYRYFPSYRLAYSCLFVCFFFIPFYISDKFYIQYIKNASQDLEDLRNNIIHSIQVHSLSTALGGGDLAILGSHVTSRRPFWCTEQ